MGKRIFKGLIYLFNAVLSLVYDDSDKCKVCDTDCGEEFDLCKSCYSKISFCSKSTNIKKENFEIVIFNSVYYNSTIKKLITNFKYKNCFASGGILAAFMIKTWLKEDTKVDYITFVPIKEEALKKRGFNQSEFLAKKIGEALNIPVISSLVIHKKLLEQKRLGGNDRWINLDKAFEVDCKSHIKGKKIMLVDDVVTTGATVFNCSVTLKKFGVLEITVLTAAKSCI